MFARLIASGANRHVMVRMRGNMKYKYERLELLPDGTELAVLRPCSDALRKEPDITPSVPVRVVHYQHPDGKPSRLCVTLLDPELYPAKELIELYHDRWEIEIAYDELKTHMLHRKESLRSQKPVGVEQEVWGLLLAYNLVRREMLMVAAKSSVSPKQVSFWTSLLRIRDFWINAATNDRARQHPRTPRRHGVRPPLAHPAPTAEEEALSTPSEDQDEQLPEEPV